jgi:hypothetical protein
MEGCSIKIGSQPAVVIDTGFIALSSGDLVIDAWGGASGLAIDT